MKCNVALENCFTLSHMFSKKQLETTKEKQTFTLTYCFVRFPGVRGSPRGQFSEGSEKVREGSEKVREGWRRSEKVGEGRRKCEKEVLEKVRES